MTAHGPDERRTKRVISRLLKMNLAGLKGWKLRVSGQENEWKRKSTYYEARQGHEPC